MQKIRLIFRSCAELGLTKVYEILLKKREKTNLLNQQKAESDHKSRPNRLVVGLLPGEDSMRRPKNLGQRKPTIKICFKLLAIILGFMVGVGLTQGVDVRDDQSV